MPRPVLHPHTARTDTSKATGARFEQRVEQLNDPGGTESVEAAGAPILIRFPGHKRTQVSDVPRVRHEADFANLALELAALAAQLGAETRCAGFE